MRHPELAVLLQIALVGNTPDGSTALVARYRMGEPRPNEVVLVDSASQASNPRAFRFAEPLNGIFASGVPGRYLVATEVGKGELSLLLPRSGSRGREIGRVRARSVAARWNPKANRVAVLDTSVYGKPGTVWIFDAESGALMRRVPDVASLAWGAGGTTLVVERLENSLSGRPLRAFAHVPPRGREQAISPKVAAASTGGTFLRAIQASEALSGKPHFDSTGDIAFSSDGHAAIVYGPAPSEAIAPLDGLPPTEASVERASLRCRLIWKGNTPLAFTLRPGFVLSDWSDRQPLFTSGDAEGVYTVGLPGTLVRVRSMTRVKGARWYWPKRSRS